ncbi:hypothetical protein [Georgenia sp. SUBG003]|uniref:hypothetical protein n=1 Tax=Georgenia sp. SUBG003 TaxID=1497974 RepID=UPI003AB8CD39
MTTLDSKHLQALREALRFERFLALPHGEEMLWAVVAPWWKVQTILGTWPSTAPADPGRGWMTRSTPTFVSSRLTGRTFSCELTRAEA